MNGVTNTAQHGGPVHGSMLVACEHCHKPFPPKRGKRTRFCSRPCLRAWQEQRRPTCQNCGHRIPPAPNLRRRKFCSHACWAQHYSRTTDVQRTCHRCGTPITIKRNRAGSVRSFCSNTCRAAWWRETTQKPCDQCGTDFSVPRHRATQRFCSQECRLAWLLPRRVSDLEGRVGEALRAAGHEVQAQALLHGFHVDFALPKRLVVVEVDGDYWHSLPAAKRHDAAEARILPLRGWRLVRVRESDLRADWNAAIHRLLEAL